MDVRLHRTPDDEGANLKLHCLCQAQCEQAVEWMERNGETASFKFLTYTACVLLWLRKVGITLGDIGPLNLASEQSTAAGACPKVIFYDVLSWSQQHPPNIKWTGYWELVRQHCPLHQSWLRGVLSTANQNQDAQYSSPDPREDPKRRSLKGGSYKVPLVV